VRRAGHALRTSIQSFPEGSPTRARSLVIGVHLHGKAFPGEKRNFRSSGKTLGIERRVADQVAAIFNTQIGK